MNHGTAPARTTSLAQRKAKVLETLNNKRSTSASSVRSSGSSEGGRASEVMRENSQLKDRLASLSKEVEEKVSAMRLLEEDLSAKTHLIEQAKTDQEKVEAENTSLQSTIDAMKTSLADRKEDTGEELEECRMELSYLEEKLASMSDEKAKLEERHAQEMFSVKDNLSRVTSERDRLASDVLKRDETITILRQQQKMTGTTHDAPATPNDEVMALRATVNDLRKQLAHFSSSTDHVILKTYEEENIKLMEQVKDIKAQLARERSTVDNEKAMLRQELSVYRTEVLDKQYNESKVNAQRDVSPEPTTKWFALANDLEHHKLLVSNLEGKVQELNRDIGNKDNLIDSLEGRIRELNRASTRDLNRSISGRDLRASEERLSSARQTPSPKKQTALADRCARLEADVAKALHAVAQAQEKEHAIADQLRITKEQNQVLLEKEKHAQERLRQVEKQLVGAQMAPVKEAFLPDPMPQATLSPDTMSRLAQLDRMMQGKCLLMEKECKRLSQRLRHAENALADISSLRLQQHAQRRPDNDSQLHAKDKIISGLKATLADKSRETEDLRRQLQLSEATRQCVHENTVTLLRQGQKDVAKVAMWYREQDLKLLKEQLLLAGHTMTQPPSSTPPPPAATKIPTTDASKTASNTTSIPNYKHSFDMFISHVETLEEEKKALEDELRRCKELLRQYERDTRGQSMNTKLTSLHKELTSLRSRIAEHERYSTPEACLKDPKAAMAYFDRQMKRIVSSLQILQRHR